MKLCITQREAVDRIANLIPFKASALSGEFTPELTFVDGLPVGRCYVVRSYVTPIATILPGGTVLLNTRHYSATTTAHMARVRQAIQKAGFTVKEYDGPDARMFESTKWNEPKRTNPAWGPRACGMIAAR